MNMQASGGEGRSEHNMVAEVEKRHVELCYGFIIYPASAGPML